MYGKSFQGQTMEQSRTNNTFLRLSTVLMIQEYLEPTIRKLAADLEYRATCDY